MFMILAGAYLPVSMRAPRLAARYGPKVVAAGVLTAAAGNLALLFAASQAPHRLIALSPGLLLAGAGQGLWIAPLTGTPLSFANPQRAGLVSGALSTCSRSATRWAWRSPASSSRNPQSRYERAFSFSLVELTGVLLLAALLTPLLAAPFSRVEVISGAGGVDRAGSR